LIEGHSEAVNDLNGGLSNFWKLLASEELFEKMKRRLEGTPFSESTWQTAVGHDLTAISQEDMVESAVQFLIQFRQSRQGLGKDFATLSRNRTRRAMNEQVSSWLSAVEGQLEAHERLKRVVILNSDPCKVIQQQDDRRLSFTSIRRTCMKPGK
jgi:DNA adenine methylase